MKGAIQRAQALLAAAPHYDLAVELLGMARLEGASQSGFVSVTADDGPLGSTRYTVNGSPDLSARTALAVIRQALAADRRAA